MELSYYFTRMGVLSCKKATEILRAIEKKDYDKWLKYVNYYKSKKYKIHFGKAFEEEFPEAVNEYPRDPVNNELYFYFELPEEAIDENGDLHRLTRENFNQITVAEYEAG
jgi:hypothetical protein